MTGRYAQYEGVAPVRRHSFGTVVQTARRMTP
jgi:hypothetical protein